MGGAVLQKCPDYRLKGHFMTDCYLGATAPGVATGSVWTMTSAM